MTAFTRTIRIVRCVGSGGHIPCMLLLLVGCTTSIDIGIAWRDRHPG